MTRIYITRMDASGFTKIAKLKYPNLGDDWMKVELKLIKEKIFV